MLWRSTRTHRACSFAWLCQVDDTQTHTSRQATNVRMYYSRGDMIIIAPMQAERNRRTSYTYVYILCTTTCWYKSLVCRTFCSACSLHPRREEHVSARAHHTWNEKHPARRLYCSKYLFYYYNLHIIVFLPNLGLRIAFAQSISICEPITNVRKAAHSLFVSLCIYNTSVVCT